MKLSPEFAQIVFWLAVASCVVAQLGIVWSTWRGLASREEGPESTSGDASGRKVHIRRAPELVWAILPAIALAFVFAGTWRAMHSSEADNAPTHRHPPANVSRPDTLLAHNSPPQLLHGIRRAKESATPRLMLEQTRGDAIAVPEESQR